MNATALRHASAALFALLAMSCGAPVTNNANPPASGADAGCAPGTCATLQKNCGTVADGCGGTLDCGTCGPDLTCGGGGVENVCGAKPCTAETNDAFCARLGKTCDDASDKDNCGVPRNVNCGVCVPTKCVEVVNACTADKECCSGRCRASLCCMPSDGACNDDPECCGGTCVLGKCCKDAGLACAHGYDCCSGTCTNGQCK